VQPITQAAAELFLEENPDARISIGGSGTSDGFEAFCKGDTQISDASRPIDVAEEVPVCEENGVEFIEIPVAFDGISVVSTSRTTSRPRSPASSSRRCGSLPPRARSRSGAR
jgi:phosphate transport system substrate-binding protein